ncbi:hypothetical protein [Bacillus nitratireducens]|uniref:hypothetical protein n=1 Tax=Bacillus nitratireducens TaxID=2026193 RepID=UPI003391F1C7
MVFFSDRELGEKELQSEQISFSVYNGIITIYKEYIRNFSHDFPRYCTRCEVNGICDTDQDALNMKIKSLIPTLDVPVSFIKDVDPSDFIDPVMKYAILDLIEFCYSKIWDTMPYICPSTYKPSHIRHFNTGNMKGNFRQEVNLIFERNEIVFFLDDEGHIQRHLPQEMNNLLQNLKVRSSDQTLNDLVNMAVENIRKPQEANRFTALEKIWDAFERIKTFHGSNKKTSLPTLLSDVGDLTDEFEVLLNAEFAALTTIGNEYQIRHFERNKKQIKSVEHVDYLFYRMIALISLCIGKTKIAVHK